MNAALEAVGPFGSVTCLDRGVFSGFVFINITKSVSISCGDGLWQGTGTALRITPPAGAKVVIEGFVSEGSGSVNQIIFDGQGTLELLRVRVTNGVSAKDGLIFSPNGPATLRIADSAFLNTTGSGILISPSAGATDAHIRDTIANGNTQGGVTVTRTGTATAKVALENVTASGNNVGLNAGVGTQASVNGGAFTDNFYGVVARAGRRISRSRRSPEIRSASSRPFPMARSRWRSRAYSAMRQGFSQSRVERSSASAIMRSTAIRWTARRPLRRWL